MIFLTVGTQFPFDRLVKAVDRAVGAGEVTEQIYAQIGNCSYQPYNFRATASLEKSLFDKYVRQASGIISHAGMGTIIMALDNNKPLLVMPRLEKYGEIVNNHQVAIAKKFDKFGHVLAVYREEDLPIKIEQLESFTPRPRSSNSEVIISRISGFLSCLSQSS